MDCCLISMYWAPDVKELKLNEGKACGLDEPWIHIIENFALVLKPERFIAIPPERAKKLRKGSDPVLAEKKMQKDVLNPNGFRNYPFEKHYVIKTENINDATLSLKNLAEYMKEIRCFYGITLHKISYRKAFPEEDCFNLFMPLLRRQIYKN